MEETGTVHVSRGVGLQRAMLGFLCHAGGHQGLKNHLSLEMLKSWCMPGLKLLLSRLCGIIFVVCIFMEVVFAAFCA